LRIFNKYIKDTGEEIINIPDHVKKQLNSKIEVFLFSVCSIYDLYLFYITDILFILF